jgi:hypothetical protein
MPDPIPRKDSDFLTWSGHFCAAASRLAVELNLPQHELDLLPPRRAAFVAAYNRAYSPARCIADSRAKNDARKALEAPIRRISRMTLYSATNLQRIDMGLKPRRVGKASPLARPVHAPHLVIRSVVDRVLNLHISTSTGRAKPHGVHCAIVYWCAGENPLPDMAKRAAMFMATRRNYALHIPPPHPPGTKIWVTAQWMNGRSLSGPTCTPVYEYVGGGGSRIGGLKRAA